LDGRAEAAICIPAKNAFEELNLEPNAQKTIEMYLY